jgi:hypothetical protein
MDDAEEREEAGRNRSGPPDGRGPAAWVRTEVLSVSFRQGCVACWPRTVCRREPAARIS